MVSTSFGDIEHILRDLFASQRYAVLGTRGATRINVSLMALVATEDLRCLILATERATSKYTNLKDDPMVGLLVDNRSNRGDDTQAAMALTINGVAAEVFGSERAQLASLLLAKHPQLESFVHSESCAVFRVDVERYELVRGIQDVREVLLG